MKPQSREIAYRRRGQDATMTIPVCGACGLRLRSSWTLGDWRRGWERWYWCSRCDGVTT